MNQKGFIPIVVVVLMIIIALGGGYLVYQQSGVKRTSTSQQTIPKPTDKIVNWEVLSSSCGFSIRYPKEFRAEDRKVINEQDPSHSQIDSICAVITAPDHVGYLGEETGLIIRINRFKIGDKVNTVLINSTDDYIRAVERDQPVDNQTDKIYGKLKGKYFITSGYFVDANFIFVNQSYLYEIYWDSNYDGLYKDYIDRILSTTEFLDQNTKNLSNDCRPTGCSGQVCSDEDVITTCEFRAEYACYKNARCERQADGKCGWTQTEELKRCIEETKNSEVVQ